MSKEVKLGFGSRMALLGGVCVSALMTAPAFAQQTPAQTMAVPAPTEEIVVTGVRKSLSDAADAKRNNVGFSDSIFAEDIGKFPDTNLAEAINRIPGIQLVRDLDGEGFNIQIRGLGQSFTKITLNGAQIAVASDGIIDAGESNRELDLNLFPGELFTKLEVDKSAKASLIEGGAAGNVDLKPAHAFDHPGLHVNYDVQGDYRDPEGTDSPRGSLIISDTFNDKFGFLLGFSGAINHYETQGWESGNQGYVTGRALLPGQTTLSTGPLGGGQFSWATTVPAGANGIDGLATGQAINPATTAGLSPTQLESAFLPRLPRQMDEIGHRNYMTELVSFEYRPLDNLHISFDTMFAYNDRQYERDDIDWIVRSSNNIVPINVKTDANNVVTSGEFANAQFFLEARPYHEKTMFFNENPELYYKPYDWLTINGQVDYNYSWFHRDANTYLINSPYGTVTYNNNETNSFPTMTTQTLTGNGSLINTPGAGWTWSADRIQQGLRETQDKGTHWDFTFGKKSANIKIGFAYDDIDRKVWAFDNSANALTFAQTAVPNAVLGNYLVAGGPSGDYGNNLPSGAYKNFVSVNYPALNAATQTREFTATAPFSGSSAVSTPSGMIREQTPGGYVEFNGITDFMGTQITFNAGVRGFKTDQSIVGPSTINNNTIWIDLKARYDSFLPSLNVAADLTDDLIFRVAGSRSVTRANPSSMLPGLVFSDQSGQTASEGNPNLAPYYSTNVDIGLEYYTPGHGYLAANGFAKQITGFTVNQVVNEPFSQLGIPLSSVTAAQLAGLSLGGNPLNSTVAVTQQVNIGQLLTIQGMELSASQPIDRLFSTIDSLKGFGFTGNYTRVVTSASGSAAVATGVAKYSYNLGGYWERYGASVHATYTYTSSAQLTQPGLNGIASMSQFSDARGQVDLSASYDLPWYNLTATFGAQNLTNAPIRTYAQFQDAPATIYYPGMQFLFGLRGKL